MHPNEKLINDFYGAFQERDVNTMASSYLDEAHFSDPVFVNLDAAETRAMWRMFCERGDDLQLAFSDVRADDASGSAHWEPIYTFKATGRKVHNKIDSTFQFKDGRIHQHLDDFDFYRWTRMALGPLGTALGWTPIIQGKVRGQAKAQLRKFMQ